jgi:hypothetical protein
MIIMLLIMLIVTIVDTEEESVGLHSRQHSFDRNACTASNMKTAIPDRESLSSSKGNDDDDDNNASAAIRSIESIEDIEPFTSKDSDLNTEADNAAADHNNDEKFGNYHLGDASFRIKPLNDITTYRRSSIF